MQRLLRWALLSALVLYARCGDEDEGDGGEDDAKDSKDSGKGGGVSSKSCKFTAPDGTYFDASGLARKGEDFSDTTPGGFTYQFNVCANTNKVCNKSPAPASKWRGGKCNNLGDADTMKMSLLDPADSSKGVKLFYNEGDICKKQQAGQTLIETRQVTYELHCDHSSDPGGLTKINEVNMCEYVIIFHSKHGCPAGGGMSRGWLFNILFLTGVALYLGVGVGIKKYKYGLTGMEAIPNVDMWRNVPGLVKDGIQFTSDNVKEGVGKLQERFQK